MPRHRSRRRNLVPQQMYGVVPAQYLYQQHQPAMFPPPMPAMFPPPMPAMFPTPMPAMFAPSMPYANLSSYMAAAGPWAAAIQVPVAAAGTPANVISPATPLLAPGREGPYAPYANAPMQQCHNWNVAAAAPLVAPVPSAAPSSIASPLPVAPISDPPLAVPLTPRRGRAPRPRQNSEQRRSPPRESPPRESPPRESPPRESPPRELPPRESPPLDDFILISDSDNDSDHWADFDFNLGHQDVPEDVQDDLECPVDESHFVVENGKLDEDYCTLCCEKYDDVNPVGILHTCHHFRWCYVCACRLLEMGHKCPRCRQVIKSVTSQEFNQALLVHDNQHEIEASVEQEQESEMGHDAREQQILAELEEVPDNMKATKEDLEKLSHDASEILKLVTTLHCKKHLQSIARGRTHSERHVEYQEGGMLFSGFGPFTLFEDMKTEFIQVIEKHCAKNSTMDNPTYQWSVLIPEAIIYGAQILFKFSKVDATAYFDKTSKLVCKLE